MSTTKRIMIAMLTGLVLGLILHPFSGNYFVGDIFVAQILDFFGQAFIALLKVLVVPIVFVSLVCGTAAIDDMRKLKRIGLKTFGLYLTTTAIAISFSLFLAQIFQPGHGFDLSTEAVFQAPSNPNFKDVMLNIFPTNPIKAMAEGNMLQIIVFAFLVGIAITMAKTKGQEVLRFFKNSEVILLKMVDIVIYVAPIGIFALIAKVFAEEGLSAILPLLKYFSTVTGALAVQAIIIYPMLLVMFARINPLDFFRRFREVMVFAFSTSSSNATLPITMEMVEKKLGVKSHIASFTLPLGATINMDGTAIMQGVATAFIAQAYGLDIGFSGFLTVILTATLASIGTAGVPGVGLITLAMVLKQVHLPVEGIALVIGVDRLLDMMRTAVNVMGDAVVTCIVARGEGAIKLPKL